MLLSSSFKNTRHRYWKWQSGLQSRSPNVGVMVAMSAFCLQCMSRCHLSFFSWVCSEMLTWTARPSTEGHNWSLIILMVVLVPTLIKTSHLISAQRDLQSLSSLWHLVSFLVPIGKDNDRDASQIKAHHWPKQLRSPNIGGTNRIVIFW